MNTSEDLLEDGSRSSPSARGPDAVRPSFVGSGSKGFLLVLEASVHMSCLGLFS